MQSAPLYDFQVQIHVTDMACPDLEHRFSLPSGTPYLRLHLNHTTATDYKQMLIFKAPSPQLVYQAFTTNDIKEQNAVTKEQVIKSTSAEELGHSEILINQCPTGLLSGSGKSRSIWWWFFILLILIGLSFLGWRLWKRRGAKPKI